MKILFNYNITYQELDKIGTDFDSFYTNKRRDSVFAAAFIKNNKIYALRDHFGIVPLFYRKNTTDIKFSTRIIDLIKEEDTINEKGLLNFIGFQSSGIVSLYDQIKMVEPGCVIRIDINTLIVDVIYRYKFSAKKYKYISKKEIFIQLDKLFHRAIERSIKHKEVGLYLSGGIDSSLIAYYLKKHGIKVNGYTSVIDQKDKHYVQSRIISEKLNIDQHFIDVVDYNESEFLLKNILKINSNPGGTTANLNIVSLWNKTDISKENQLYFGQNLDTLFMAMANQYRVYFVNLLPRFLQNIISFDYYGRKYYMNRGSLIGNYLNYRSKGYVQENEILNNVLNHGTYSKSQMLVLAGIICGHTPADSDAFALPAINRNKIISNPYYDLDLAEFLMGLPLKYRLDFSPKLKKIRKPLSCFTISKRLFFEFAAKILPKDIVFPKKSFMTPKMNLISDKIRYILPSKINGIFLNNIQSQISVFTLNQWLNEQKINNYKKS